MKAKHVFTTLGLALTMGLGVAAGLSHVREFKQAKAEMQSWYVVGTFDGVSKWNAESGYAMTEETTNVWVKRALKFKVNDEFKVCDEETDHWQGGWSYNNGDSNPKTYFTAANDGANIVCKTEGYYDVTFTKSDYHIKVDKLSTFTVQVYIDGVKQTDQQVASGALPTVPSHYGKTFSGWFDNAECSEGHEVDEITGPTTVYGKMTTLPTITYSVDFSKAEDGKFATKNFYAYDDGGENAAWPGLAIPSEPQAITVPTDAKIVINAGQDKEQTVNIEQSGIANDTLYILETKTGDKYNYQWGSDIPAKQDTYYVVGTETNWKYTGAPEMSTTSEFKKDNTAVLFDYEAEANEEIKIRGVFGGEEKWYGVGGEGGANYKFDAAGTYDFYLNASKELYVADVSKRHTITTVCNLYAGKASEGMTTFSEYGYDGSAFTPYMPVDGYVRTALHISSPTNPEYVSADLEGQPSSVWFYADFMKIGTYLVGDEKFAGQGLAWNIKGGQLMTGPTETNSAEAVISISGATEQAPVCVKGVDYHVNEALDSHYLSWDIAPSDVDPNGYKAPTYVHVDGDGNLAFTQDGTYAIYISKANGKAYFNVGFDAFNTLFLDEVGAVCEEDGSTEVSALQAVWTKMKAAYGNLSPEDKAKYNPGKTIDSGKTGEGATDQEKVIAKYKYIVATKYGTDICEDFIWGGHYLESSSNNVLRNNSVANNTALVVILVATISVISAAGLFLVIRRRKHN